MNENYTEQNSRQERGSRPLLVIGIILLNISIFMAAFVFSFNMIVNPIGQRDEEIRLLTEENIKLKNDTQLLQDQVDVMQSELETYRKRYGSDSSSSRSSRSYENESDSRSSSRSSSADRSNSDDEMNMDDE